MNKNLNDIVNGDNTNAIALGDGTSELWTNSWSNNFGRIVVGENNACQKQVLDKNIDRFKKAVVSAVMTVENWMHDAIFDSNG